MIDPRQSQKSVDSSRIALAIALLLAGAFGLGAAYYIKPKAPTDRPAVRDSPAPAPPETPPAEVRPEPAPRPSSRPSPAGPNSADRLIAFCTEHVSATRSFVIFRYGSCVVVDEPSVDPLADALSRLEACNQPDARFVPELTTNGDLIVSFKEPVFHTFSAEMQASVQDELERLTPALLTPKERVSAGDDWVPPTHARFGLLARRRMLEDAAKPVPIRIIRAKQRVTVEN